MRTRTVLIFLASESLLPFGIMLAQDRSSREIEVRPNVKLVEIVPTSDFPEVFKQRFLDFLPMFEGVAKENTPGRTPECALTIQIEPIIKTVTFGKEEQRVKALVTIFRKGATREFFGELLIHSYITGGLVDKEETAKFLHQLLLAPLICPPGKTN